MKGINFQKLDSAFESFCIANEHFAIKNLISIDSDCKTPQTRHYQFRHNSAKWHAKTYNTTKAGLNWLNIEIDCDTFIEDLNAIVNGRSPDLSLIMPFLFSQVPQPIIHSEGEVRGDLNSKFTLQIRLVTSDWTSKNLKVTFRDSYPEYDDYEL